jgi:homoserine acetyltransferase
MMPTRFADIGDLPLTRGGTLRAARLAYVTYGTLAPDGRNTILLTHGYTSSHLFADRGVAASEGPRAELVGPGRAITEFDATPDLAKITARVMYVLSRTDALHPPKDAETAMPALAAAGVDARYVEIDSPHGHHASGADAAKRARALAAFIAELAG